MRLPAILFGFLCVLTNVIHAQDSTRHKVSMGIYRPLYTQGMVNSSFELSGESDMKFDFNNNSMGYQVSYAYTKNKFEFGIGMSMSQLRYKAEEAFQSLNYESSGKYIGTFTQDVLGVSLSAFYLASVDRIQFRLGLEGSVAKLGVRSSSYESEYLDTDSDFNTSYYQYGRGDFVIGSGMRLGLGVVSEIGFELSKAFSVSMGLRNYIIYSIYDAPYTIRESYWYEQRDLSSGSPVVVNKQGDEYSLDLDMKSREINFSALSPSFAVHFCF